jgi:hypothetical protein
MPIGYYLMKGCKVDENIKINNVRKKNTNRPLRSISKNSQSQVSQKFS